MAGYDSTLKLLLYRRCSSAFKVQKSPVGDRGRLAVVDLRPVERQLDLLAAVRVDGETDLMHPQDRVDLEASGVDDEAHRVAEPDMVRSPPVTPGQLNRPRGPDRLGL